MNNSPKPEESSIKLEWKVLTMKRSIAKQIPRLRLSHEDHIEDIKMLGSIDFGNEFSYLVELRGKPFLTSHAMAHDICYDHKIDIYSVERIYLT